MCILFNGILTFVGYLMPKNHCRIILVVAGGSIKGFIIFHRQRQKFSLSPSEPLHCENSHRTNGKVLHLFRGKKNQQGPVVSLDIISQFTRLPTDETLTGIRAKLVADLSLEKRTCIPKDNLMEMLTFYAETTYFGKGSGIYWHMGSPLSPVLANIYLEYFDVMV